MAIAFDASTVWQFATTTSLSWSHTCTGANGILFVGVKVVSGSDVVTGVTYNSVAMTRVEFQVFSGQAYYLYVLAGPATGANNVVVSVSSSLNTQARSVSYTGAKQTNTVDNHSNNTQASGTSIAGTLTTVADNCWVVGFFQNNIDTGATAGANTTLRSIDGTQNVIMGDSNAAKTPAGSVTLNYQWTGTATGQVLFASFAPVPPVSPTVSYDWPNPRRVVPSPQRFSVEGNRNQALFFVPPPPPSISTYGWNWPNPVRRVNAPAWQQSLTGSLVIPRDADYFYGLVWISVDGVARAQGRSGSAGIDFASLTISDELDQTPNTCQFVARGFMPTVGQTVIASLGSATTPNPERIFAGTVLRVQQVYSGTPANQSFQVSCIDWTWQLSKRKVIKQYTGWTATAIAIDLINTYTTGFTCGHVAGLGVIDAISFTNVDLTDALTQLAKRAGGYWYVDYNKDLHFYVTEGVTPPTPLTASHPSLSDFSITRDLSQWITRQYSEGGGGKAAGAVSVGDTILPVDVSTWYQPAGGLVACGSQRLTYTGVQAGGGGTLVGPGAAPAAVPVLSLAAGSGLGTGVYQYAYTDVTAAGESLPSPIASITTGLTAPPSAAPLAALASGGGMDVGTHDYVVTFVTGSGETSPSAISAPVTTSIPTPVPDAPFILSDEIPGNIATGAYTWVNSYTVPGVGEVFGPTLDEPASFPAINWEFSISALPAGATQARLWRTPAGPGTPFKFVGTYSGLVVWDRLADAGLGAAAPTAATPFQSVVLSAIPTGDGSVTSRNLYRRFNGSGTFKLVTTIANNTATTYTDTAANASLGAAAPSSNTATANRTSVSAIAIGASAVTARKVYRTPVGASQLKLLTTLADNTTTTFADSTADGSLGANAPTSDTSALAQPSGQILAGQITLLVAGAGAFSSGGGWAIIGNGQQTIRYTGISGNTLTGIPSSGIGAITATVSYNSTVTAAPALTGIPSSSTGSIVYAIPAGTPVNLLAQVDDIAGQTALAGLIGGDGVQEAYVVDGRIAYTEALARANARIALNNAIRESIAYVVRDPQTASGKTIVVNLVAPTSVTSSYKIQRVTITQFSVTPGLFPTYTADASSDKLSFEDELKNIIGGTT